MLSKTKYSSLCVLGAEVFYAVCIAYGLLLAGKAQELHHSIFELIPGFAWSNPASVVWGALYMGALTWIAGWYIAWMHNASLVGGR